MTIKTLIQMSKDFISSPKKLFWFYIFVNMLPSFFLCVSEPYNLIGKIVLLLFPLAIYIIVFCLFKNNGLLQVILFPVLFIHAFQLVLLYLFGEDVIAVDMFLNVITTNPSEAGELLNSLWVSVIFVCVVYIPTTVIAIRQWKKKIYLQATFRYKTIGLGIVLLIASFILSFFSIDKNTESYTFHEHVYPVNAYYNFHFALGKWDKSNRYPTTSKNFVFNATKTTKVKEREIYVLVIGETSRADNWSLYGYERQTNPKLEQEDRLTVFADAITQSNATHKSVSIMMTDASAEFYERIYTRKSILTAFKEVGFSTLFLSNQGANGTFTEYFAQEADYFKDIRSAQGMHHISLVENKFDQNLIPILQHCIDSIPGNIFAVLHTYGSHFNYKERYPNKYAQFAPDNVTKITKKERDKLINAFDNSILYTDCFLSQIMSLLKNESYSSAVLYSSDHGEDILDDARERFLHASPSPTYYQLKIPMLLWFSEQYEINNADKVANARKNKTIPVATNSVFHTMLDMASIETDYLEEDLSLVSSTFKPKKRMYLNDHDQPILYYKMNLKKEDLEMIGKRKMHK